MERPRTPPGAIKEQVSKTEAVRVHDDDDDDDVPKDTGE
jgi:hypothetical protein